MPETDIFEAAHDASRAGWYVAGAEKHPLIAINPTNKEEVWVWRKEDGKWEKDGEIKDCIPLCKHHHELGITHEDIFKDAQAKDEEQEVRELMGDEDSQEPETIW